MAEYNLFMGGLAGNSNNEIVPQNTPCSINGYADHQRRRSYAVTRQLDFRPRVPYGGIDGVVDQKDYSWYQRLLATGVDVEVGDFLNLIVITPYSRLEWAEAQVVLPVTGLVATLCRRVNVCPGSPATSTVAITAASNSGLAVNDIGENAGIFWSTRIDSSLDDWSMLALEITAVPGTAPEDGGNLKDWFAIFQAEVVDWGSYDFNGNA